jgi:hypothetical protein
LVSFSKKEKREFEPTRSALHLQLQVFFDLGNMIFPAQLAEKN